MDVADEIAHCAMMIDQARDLMERGMLVESRARAERARDHARTAQRWSDPGHQRQVRECIDAAEAILRKLDGLQSRETMGS